MARHTPQSCFILADQSNTSIVSCDLSLGETTTLHLTPPAASTAIRPPLLDCSQLTTQNFDDDDDDHNEFQASQSYSSPLKPERSVVTTELCLPDPSCDIIDEGVLYSSDGRQDAEALNPPSLSLLPHCSESRATFLARVLHLRSDSLFVVAVTAASNKQEMVKLRLKPSFPIAPEGLRRHLHQPGAWVLLRDVVCNRRRRRRGRGGIRRGADLGLASQGGGAFDDAIVYDAVCSWCSFTMDSCSLVVPVPFCHNIMSPVQSTLCPHFTPPRVSVPFHPLDLELVSPVVLCLNAFISPSRTWVMKCVCLC